MSGAGTRVVGLGQRLGGDDAVGLVVASRLREGGIAAIDVPDGAALADVLMDCSGAVIIDAVVGAGAPGTVVHLRGEELSARSGRVPVSSHGLSVAEAVAIAQALGGAGDAHLIGVAIEPPQGPSGLGDGALSEPVRAAVDVAAARVRAVLLSMGLASASNTGAQPAPMTED